MKFLVLEYEMSAIGAYHSKNDYHTGLVEKFMVERNPIETAKEYGLLKHNLEATLKDESEGRINRLVSAQQVRLAVLTEQIDKQKALIGRLRDKIFSQGVIHAEGQYSNMCRPTFYGFRKTIDYSFVTCKKCLEALKREALLKKQWEERDELT